MDRTLTADCQPRWATRASVRGWVQAIRDQKRVQFLVVRDEAGAVQVVLGKDDPPSELNEAVSALTPESAVTVTGSVVADERVNLGGLELQLEELHVDSLAEPELPIAPDSALDKRIDWRYLDLRRPDRRLIFEVQSTVEHAMREFWRPSASSRSTRPSSWARPASPARSCSRSSTSRRTAYLAQSPQFYKQMAMAGGL